MFYIESQRLRLIPLTTEQIILFQKSRTELQLSLGLEPSEVIMDEAFAAEINDDTFAYWINHTRDNPDRYQWFTNWEIVHRDKNQSIGGIGLGNWPDENGESMIGYVIDERHQNMGFCSEAVARLLEWMWENEELLVVIADTPEDNFPSQRVLRKNGFTKRYSKDGIFRWELKRF